MSVPKISSLSETIRLLSAALPKDLLFSLAKNLQGTNSPREAKTLFIDCFTHYDCMVEQAGATPAADWLAADPSATLAWEKIANEDTYTTIRPEDRGEAIEQGIHLFRSVKPLQLYTLKDAIDALQHWFDYHGTLHNTWRLGVLVAIREVARQDANARSRPASHQLLRLENEALRGLRAIKALEEFALAGGASHRYIASHEINEAFETHSAALTACINEIRSGFYPVQRNDHTSDERTLAYRFIALYLTIGLEPLDARITPLLDIGGQFQPSDDRFRRMMEKLVAENKGINPTLEIRRLFTAARG